MELGHTQRLLIRALAALTLLRWALAGLHDLTPDEALLAEWTRHPFSLAGVDGGALPAWFAAAGRAVFGDTAFGVRFPAPLFAAGASWMLYRVSHSLSGEKTAAWAVALFNLMPLTNLAAVQMRPETPGVFLLLAGMSAVWRGVRRASPWDWHWPLAGALFGAAMLCWHGAVFGIVGAFLLLAGARRWRGFLRRPGPWLMLLWFLAFLWPLYDWNARNAWCGWHALRDELFPRREPVRWLAPLELAGQWMLAVSPVMFGAMLWALERGAGFWRRDDTARFAAAFALPPLVASLGFSFMGGARAAWAAPALPALCLLLPWAWENVVTNLRLKNLLQWLCVLPALLLAPLALDTDLLRHAGAPVPYEHDPSRHRRGWRTTAREVAAAAREALPQAPEGLFLIARDGRLASVLNFYLPPDLPVLRPSPEYPLVHALENPAPQNAWHFWPRYDAAFARGGVRPFLGKSALFITDKETGDAPRRVRLAFRSVEPVAVFDVLERGLRVRRVKVFACRDYRGLPF